MTRTAVVFSPTYYRHNPGKGHPESAKRLGTIVNELKGGRLSCSPNWRFIEPKEATIENLELIHDGKYVKHVERVCTHGGGILDSGDTVVSLESFRAALLAVGGTLKAVETVMEKQFENAFALVRPPGHHAGKSRAMGFCVFNNIAIAGRYLLKKFNLDRILILDIDAHHGNGTQEAFYDTDKILYISIHQDPRDFPGTGFIEQAGRGKGSGYTVNIPLPFKTTDCVYLRAFNEIVVPIARQYRPQFILVSAGLDGHYSDPVGSLSLSAHTYQELFETIVSLASTACRGKLVFALEGGYSLRWVGKIAACAVARMSGAQYSFSDEVRAVSPRRRKAGEMVIQKVKEIQNTFWNLR